MSHQGSSPAVLPPPGLAQLDPSWSRLVAVPDLDGDGRTFHILDNGVVNPRTTLLCVHGNPSWSYLWRELIAGAPPDVRVIAIDQLGMGFSERTGAMRRLRQRIDDLCALTDQLQIDGPVVTVAHDWGGPVSLGWAQRNRDELAGVVLMNTAVHQPPKAPAPRLIRMVRIPGVLRLITVKTTAFLLGAVFMSRRRASKDVRQAFLAPYLTPDRREAIGDFVEDIPLDPSHPTEDTLDEVASGLEEMQDVPTLLLWGPSDPVFSDIYLHDFEQRLPHAEVHRFIGARHYLPEEVDVATPVHDWVDRLWSSSSDEQPDDHNRPRLWEPLEARSEDSDLAITEMTADGDGRSLSFAELTADVNAVAAGLAESGVRLGDRVALLVPPGIDLTVCVYACWSMGAVTVVADAGLGAKGIGTALRSADPDYLIGIPKALAAARTLRWPGKRIAAHVDGEAARVLGAWATLDQIRRRGATAPHPPRPDRNDLAAVVFTSGATGPAKGVRYRHHQAEAQRDALMNLYQITSDDRLVAAFAPFALYGPGMGITSVVPDMDVTAPATLTASALGDAVAAARATLVFASPAALRNVVATSDQLTVAHHGALSRVRTLMSAGAPVTPELLSEAVRLTPNAQAHTPYGMTEVLPVAGIDLESILEAGRGNGVCVGRPVNGVAVKIDPLDELGAPVGTTTTEAGVTGEVCVSAAHVKDGYDRLWVTQEASAQPTGWHRTGDVGHFDPAGRLWIEGRLVHVVSTASGPVTPVGLERTFGSLPNVDRAAVVGVGPTGTQQLVVVVEDHSHRPGLATTELSDQVRAAVDVDVAAVLIVKALPVDSRHNSKINRTRIAAWAANVLAGNRIGRL